MRRPPGTFRDRESGEELTREEAFALMSARHQKLVQAKAKKGAK